MGRGTTEFKPEFLEFLNDPGIGVRYPGTSTLVLEDLFVFPDLMLSTAGIPSPGTSGGRIISSRDLIQFENLSPLIFISGPGDSGKTTLLKSLMKRYNALGLYPLYIDGNHLGNFGADEPGDIIRSTYEEQYTEESLSRIYDSEKGKKICLLDNFDGLKLDRELIILLIDEFGLFVATASAPLLGEVISSELVNDRAQINFELMEFSLDLRRELCEKWHNLGLDPGSGRDNKETAIRVESALGIMDEVIGRDLVPSYPLILLTILNIGESGKEETTSESSYGRYFEHLITKPIKESMGSEELNAFMHYLSKLANLMFTENKSSVSVLELTELHDDQLRDNKLPGRAEDTINKLLATRTLDVTESGFCYMYNYIYHYFAALYLARNLGLESVKDDVRLLCHNLGDREYANIMLFLTYLSDDPYILDEITAVLAASETTTSPESVDEETREIDKLIESILSTSEKDKKLRELRAEYASSRERLWVPASRRRTAYEYKPASYLELMRRHIEKTHKELRLLDIAGVLLNKRLRGRPEDSANMSLARTIYLFWLRSLGACSENLLKPVEESSGDTGTTYERDHGPATGSEEYIRELQRISLALNIFSLYIRRLSRALGSITLSELFDREEERVPPGSFTLFDLTTRPWHGTEAIKVSEIESFSRTPGTGNFARELVRLSALWHLRKSYSGAEFEIKLTELEKSLTF